MNDARDSGEITVLLRRLSAGDKAAEKALIPQVYHDLRRLAATYLRKERPDHSLQPTALVHEAYLRLTSGQTVQWEDRSHFFRVAAGVMRRILVDNARFRKADKRNAGRPTVVLEDFFSADQFDPDLVLDVDSALDRLATLDSRQAKVVELRFFGGLSEEEIGSILDISSRTVKREWAMAKAWLRGELAP